MQTWKTVRVFVSSTFRDMQGERDYLARVIFPELREKMKSRNLHLLDLDLRWGVTEEEAEQGKVLDVILREIDRSRPFFIGILGERFGSLPDKVPLATQRMYPWLQEYKGYSYTSLEIIHGVLRNPKLVHRSFFYFRDPQLIGKISPKSRVNFEPENANAAKKLASLKSQILSSGTPVMESYPCKWDEESQSVVDLEVFGQKVLEDLWNAVCREYPVEAPESDPVASERQMHEAFVEERSSFYIGRTGQATQLTRYVQGSSLRPILITGESGCGKSAFLANWYQHYSQENPNDYILAYFIGASPDSTNHYLLLRNMCNELKRKFELKELPIEERKLSEMLYGLGGYDRQLASILTEIVKRAKVNRVIILIDALDQLLPFETTLGLGWLLDNIPNGVHLVVSCLEGDYLEVLRRREAEEIVLPPLSIGEQRQIVCALLEMWGRKLDEEQTSALLAHPEAKNPLYLRVALEELKLFGRFEQLMHRINDLPPNIAELFNQVLDRLEKDHGTELVSEAFGLIGCSRYGLSEVELLELLSDSGTKSVPMIRLTRLEFSAKMYLVSRGALVGFFHRQLDDAIKARYFPGLDIHGRLADYFGRSPFYRRVDELPFQCQLAKNWEALAAALSDLDLLKYAVSDGRENEWVVYWHLIKDCFQADQLYKAEIEKKVKQEGKSQNVSTLASTVGHLLIGMAFYSSAATLLQMALEIDEAALEKNHPNIATDLNNLAGLYYVQGRFDEALPLAQKALEIDKTTLGKIHPKIAWDLRNLSYLYRAKGRFHEALPLAQYALKIDEAAFGKNDKTVARDLSILGELYHDQGRFDEALPLYQRALKIDEAAHGKNHPDIARDLNSLAVLYYAQGRFDEALPLYQRALKIDEAARGKNHPDIARDLHNLAFLYSSQRRFDKALPLYQRALEIAEATLGRNHPNTDVIRKSLNACMDKLK